MNSNENQNPSAITSTVFDPQLRTLMSIRHFHEDLENYISRVESATREMNSVYEKGISMLKQSATKENNKQWEEAINEIRVDANQLNQVLVIARDRTKNREAFDFPTQWKDFENRLKDLKNSARNFENMGAKQLDGESKKRWESDICIFESRIEPEILKNTHAANLILEFMFKYDAERLERIMEIIDRNVPENTAGMDPKDLEAGYLKAMREFQREFKPQNLWDVFLEILAGGVHPSPSERVMLEKWADGEQKTREDM